MKVIQVVPSIGAESSGPSYSVPAMCKGLVGCGCEVELHILAPKPEKDFPFDVMDYPVAGFPTRRLGHRGNAAGDLRRCSR